MFDDTMLKTIFFSIVFLAFYVFWKLATGQDKPKAKKFFPITYAGKITYVEHNMRQSTCRRLYKRWAWKTGQTSPHAFVEYINGHWWHRLIGRKAECWDAPKKIHNQI